MLKIKIEQIFLHRNETTFRPYLMAERLFRDVGIQFVFEGNDYDMLWVGQHTYLNKSKVYSERFYYYEKFLKSIPNGVDFVLFDGQDSASLMGSYEAMKFLNPKLLLKNTLYSNKSDYKTPSIHGRTYWGSKEGFNFQIDEEVDWSKIMLSGANWLSTVTPHWYDYKNIKKDIDVCALFSYPAKQNFEWEVLTNPFYDEHRRKCIEQLEKLPPSIKVAMLEDGKKIPIEQYYDIMKRSKIVVAPFGYGEIAPRDIEASMFGAVLVKPDMSHVETLPNPYKPSTFASCDWEYQTINNLIESIVRQFNVLQEAYTENMRKAFVEDYSQEKLVTYTYNWISNLDGYGIEN